MVVVVVVREWDEDDDEYYDDNLPLWYGIDNPDLVEEEAVVEIGDAGDMETGDAVESNEEAMADDAFMMLEEALC